MQHKKILMIKGIFYAMILIFILIVGFFIIPDTTDIHRALFPVLAVLGILFFIYGAALIYFTFKQKIKGKQKTFLLLTGFSALGFPVSVILHNFFYALGVLAGNIVVLKSILEFLHAAFFLIGLIGCPIGFLIGVIGSIVKFKRKIRKIKINKTK